MVAAWFVATIFMQKSTSAARHLLANLRQAALMQVPVEAAHTPIGMLRSFLRLHSVRNWTQLC